MVENNKKFVVQKHTRCDDVHWDLMLEVGQELETYRLNVPPDKLAQGAIASATRNFNHPLKFLTYEGSVNKGQGTVEIAESGTYIFLSRDEHLQEIQLDGKVLQGKFTLTHIEENCWEFELAADG